MVLILKLVQQVGTIMDLSEFNLAIYLRIALLSNRNPSEVSTTGTFPSGFLGVYKN